MPRIAGVNIPTEKQIRVALTYIYGIGPSSSRKILKAVDINPDKKTKDLSEKEIATLTDYIEKNFRIEGDLRREIINSIKRLRRIRSWRGLRHERSLPVRGQRTKRNSRTVRGNVRRTVGSGRRKPPAPK